MSGWIGVDLDGTLAIYDEWRGPYHLGAPVPRMVQRVRAWLAEGKDVRIFTARLTPGPDRDVEALVAIIQDWCTQHLGRELPITNVKDYGMVELWDDRVVQVTPNTGQPAALLPCGERDLTIGNLRAALELYGGDKRRAAAHLGVSLKTIYNRLQWPEFRS